MLRKLVLILAVVSVCALIASSAYAEHKGGIVNSVIVETLVLR